MLSDKMKTYLNNTLFIVTESETVFNYIKKLADGYECVFINNVEIFIESLEEFTPVQFITLVITDTIPSDIKTNMSLFVDTLKEMRNLNHIEFLGEESYFDNSMKIRDVYEFEKIKEIKVDKVDKVDNNANNKIDGVSLEKEPVSDDDSNKRISELNDLVYTLDKKLKSNLNELEKVIGMCERLEIEKEELRVNLDDKEKELDSLRFKEGKSESKHGDLIDELTAKDVMIKNLEKDIKELKVLGVELEIDSSSKTEMIKDKNREIRELKRKIEDLNKNIESLVKDIGSIEESTVSLDKLEELGNVLEEKDMEILSLNEQVRVLRIDERKAIDEFKFLEEEYDNLEESYKSLVTSGNNDADTDYRGIYLSDDVKTGIFYFKIFSQPPYFNSFVKSLNRLLEKNGKTLMIIIRELDNISKNYYKNINIYKNLEDVDINIEEVIVLTPSKFMLTEDESFYSSFNNIILLDYTRTDKILLKGTNVFSINTFINEKEKDMLGVSGMTLTVGETSIVDLKYDDNFKFAKTDYVKKVTVDKKVKNWLSNIGISV